MQDYSLSPAWMMVALIGGAVILMLGYCLAYVPRETLKSLVRAQKQGIDCSAQCIVVKKRYPLRLVIICGLMSALIACVAFLLDGGYTNILLMTQGHYLTTIGIVILLGLAHIIGASVLVIFAIVLCLNREAKLMRSLSDEFGVTTKSELGTSLKELLNL